LSLGETGGTGGEVLGVGGKPLGGQAEAGARAGRVLEEEVEDNASLERGNLLAAPRGYLGERLGRVQNGHDLSGGQVFQPQQVLSGPAWQRPDWGGNRRRAGTGTRAGWRCNGHGAGLLSGCEGREAATTRTISSTGSNGCSRTRTRSLRSVGRCSPTKSGWMGNSRCPRSTSTASRIRPGRPRSQIALSAARTVRPVNKTSSTRTISAPSTGKAISVPRSTGQRRPRPRSSR